MFYNPFPILLTAIFFSTLMDKTLPKDLRFEACKPQNCGNGPNISYPFRISNRQESYCGHPNFEVTCNGQNPILTISNDDYIVKDIFYTNNSLLLANEMAYDLDNTCPIPQHNFSIGEGSPLEYSLGFANLFFFYNCTSYPIDPTYPVACASNSTHYSFAVFDKAILEYKNYSIESCCDSVNAPVEGESIRKLLEADIGDVLREGFVLQWSEANCSGCRRSGGRCGFVGHDFVCFCPDRTHSSTCDCGKCNSTWLGKLGFDLFTF